MNSRAKGARGEREAAAELVRIGLGKSRRGRQYNGLEGRDVICDALPNVHVEVKRVETFNAYAAMEQAQRDAGGALPVVMHKRNRKDWLLVVRADDLIVFAEKVLAAHAALDEAAAREENG